MRVGDEGENPNPKQTPKTRQKQPIFKHKLLTLKGCNDSFGLLCYKNLRVFLTVYDDTVKPLGTYVYSVHKMSSLNIS